MKQLVTIFLTFWSLSIFGQSQEQDFNNLVKLGEVYSKNVNGTGADFKKSVEALRTPNLNHIIDALIATGKGDKRLLTNEFLTKPSLQELKYWYVLQEILNNHQSKDAAAKSSEQVARETLAKEIDTRWLLDNYYYQLHGGIAQLFNNNNLSKYNFNLDDYGLENVTEKAILFFSLSYALTQRFQVLQMMQNYGKLLDYAAKMPTFNGKPYYEYTAFDFDDFEWMADNKIESYKARNLGNLYAVLNDHFSALAHKNKTVEVRQLYFKSILRVPCYFKYATGIEKNLQDMYNQTSKSPDKP